MRKKLFNKKYFWVYAFIAVFLLTLTFGIIPKAMADFSNAKQVNNAFDDFLKGFSVTSFSKMAEAYESFKDFLSPTSNSASIIPTFTEFIKVIAQVLILFYAFISIIQEAEKAEFTTEMWTKLAVRTAVAILAVVFTGDLLDTLYKLGNWVINESQNVLDMTGVTIGPADRTSMIEGLSTLPGLGDLKKVLLTDASGEAVNWYELQGAGSATKMLNYVVWFPMAVCIFLTFSALFEVKVRQIFAPIAVASIANEGARGAGVRYLKKYLASFIKIAVYFAIAALGTILTFYFKDRIGSGGFSAAGMDMNVVFMLLSNVVAGLAMMQSGGIGDEIVGV